MQTTVTLPAVPVSVATVLPQSVVIDVSRPVIDNGPTPRKWTVSADTLSVSATA